MATTGKREQIRVVKGDSLLSLASLVAAGWTSSFDVIYVDASHQVKYTGTITSAAPAGMRRYVPFVC